MWLTPSLGWAVPLTIHLERVQMTKLTKTSKTWSRKALSMWIGVFQLCNQNWSVFHTDVCQRQRNTFSSTLSTLWYRQPKISGIHSSTWLVILMKTWINTMTSTEQVRYLDLSYPECLTPSCAEYLFAEYTAIRRKDKSIKNFLPYNKVSSYSEYSTWSNLNSYRMPRY